MFTFISAASGLIVVFLLAAGAIYSSSRVYRALSSGRLSAGQHTAAETSAPEHLQGSGSAASEPRETSDASDMPDAGRGRATAIAHATPRERVEERAEAAASSYLENGEDEVPLIFRRPTA
ncbi:hypothetical protein CQ018_04610 [Arthrobacter sp. MYb227]|uniref:hypothetical protein n=1 Tax=Arthrobacter sp. MYb227 TaxID=1848601 RepID=UPI000CFC5DB3|nr:hypothetical protein [Arthrobacter sp. MYb227]PQZ94641.1 hypothetical protein CQ018_04610 [Arthrobacter sp. MYb227]